MDDTVEIGAHGKGPGFRRPARAVCIAEWDDLPDRAPVGARVGDVDLVIVRWGDRHSVLYGRCLHRGALLSDGRVEGDDLVCGLHGWDYRFDTGVSSYDPSERLHRFSSLVDEGRVWVDADEIDAWAARNPQRYDRTAYQGAYRPVHDTPEEPHVGLIRRLAADGLNGVGPKGPITAMGVPRDRLPSWDDLQFVTAQLARRPLLDDAAVETSTIIGPGAARPLRLDIPVLVSDMSFGSISEEAKVALARGAEQAGTAIGSGEGGILPEELAASTRYMYELASGRFGWSPEVPGLVRAVHLKFGQATKTGIGGYLPGDKVTGRIAEIRGLPEGAAAVSPATFVDVRTVEDVRHLVESIRAAGDGIPVGFKLSAQHIEDDLDAAVEAGADYVILDGRGGGTGAAPVMFRDHISVPTIPALVRARRHLDGVAPAVTLVITGGLRTPWDFAKAMALGADAVAVSNAALQAIGCVGMRACHTNNCPVGIATQQPHLRSRLPVEAAADRLARFLVASTELMQVLARACGRRRLADLDVSDLTTFDLDMHHLTGVRFGGIAP